MQTEKQRERLVELLRKADENTSNKMITDYEDAIKDNADYLIANNVVVLPMKLGQICYEPLDYRNSIDECRVSSLTQKADGSFKIRLTNIRGKWVFEITEDEIGKRVFLSRAEAEAKLKENEK